MMDVCANFQVFHQYIIKYVAKNILFTDERMQLESFDAEYLSSLFTTTVSNLAGNCEKVMNDL